MVGKVECVEAILPAVRTKGDGQTTQRSQGQALHFTAISARPHGVRPYILHSGLTFHTVIGKFQAITDPEANGVSSRIVAFVRASALNAAKLAIFVSCLLIVGCGKRGERFAYCGK